MYLDIIILSLFFSASYTVQLSSYFFTLKKREMKAKSLIKKNRLIHIYLYVHNYRTPVFVNDVASIKPEQKFYIYVAFLCKKLKTCTRYSRKCILPTIVICRQ